MSLDSLAKTLDAAITPQKELDLTGALVGAPQIGTLIKSLYPDGTVKIGGAAVQYKSGDTSVRVTGQVDLVKSTGADVTVTFTYTAADVLEMDLRVLPADGWKMTEMFPVLPDKVLETLGIANAAVILASMPVTDTGTGRTLDPGLNLTGTLGTAVFKYLKPILGAAFSKGLAIAGPIRDFALPLFEWRTAPVTGALGPARLDGLCLIFGSVGLDTGGGTIAAMAETALEAKLKVDKVQGTIRANLPIETSTLALKAEFSNLTMNSFVALADYMGPVDPFKALPPPVTKAVQDVGSVFELKSLGLAFDISTLSFSAVDLGLQLNLNGFNIFSDIKVLQIDEIDLNFHVTPKSAQISFEAEAEISIGGVFDVILAFQTQADDGYRISVERAPGAPLHLTQVLTPMMPGLTGYPDVDVATFSLVLLPNVGEYTLDLVILSDWEIIKTPALTLDEIDISAAYYSKLTPKTSGKIVGILSLAVDGNSDNDVRITLSAEKPKGKAGWSLQGITAPGEPIPIGHLFTAITRKFTATATVPKVLNDMTIQDLDLSFETEEKTFHFGAAIKLPFEDDITLDITLNVNVEPLAAPKTGYEVKLAGSFIVSDYRFDIVFDHKTNTSDTLIASYAPAGNEKPSISLKDLLNGISPKLGDDVPVNITIELKDVKFVFYRDPQTNKLAFGLDVGIPIDLSHIPIVGDKLPKDMALGISNLQGVYATKDFPKDEITAINALLPDVVQPFPEGGLGQGINVAAELEFGSTKKTFTLAGPKKTSGPQVSPMAIEAADYAAAVAASGGDSFKWLNINKQIGIFQFNRAGAGYKDNVLSFALDAGVSLGPLTFTMDGLSVGSPLDKFDPRFSLSGLGLAFNRPPLSISGNFLKVEEPLGTSYYGQVAVQASEIGFSALGGWSPDASPPSFFLYASVDVPLGGPPYLFVNGLAAGLGINRDLLLPTMEDLPGYILLPGHAPAPAGSPSETVSKILPQLQKYVQNKPGQYWVAAGIKFSSFEMIDAFVLVTVSFGNDFQLGILGSAAMSIPPAVPNPVAYLEVDLVASFTPAAGELAVYGRISPQSFIFGDFVKLSGGFAFCIWFSGDHAGDFVVTIGGYYPSYTKPPNYPKVPRLGLTFSLGPLNVTGASYFALTPSMLMAGLNLSAVFKAGPIKAWFDAGLNFLIAWAPFHYEVQIYIHVGVSADLGLFTIDIHIGADMFVWGPPFGGRAHIDLSVISFTISFGAEQEPPPPVGWESFKSKFLPAGTPDKTTPEAVMLAANVAAPSAPAETSNIVKAQVKDGLIKSDSDDFDWIVSPTHFEILVQSAVPANKASWTQPKGKKFDIHNDVTAFQHARPTVGEPFLFLDKGTKPFSAKEVWNPTLDIGPMKEKGVTSELTVAVKKHLDSDPSGVFSDPKTDIAVAPRLSSSNTALWATVDTKDANAPRLLEKTLTGFALTPEPRFPDKVSNVPLIQLLFIEGNDVSFAYQAPDVVPGYTIKVAQPAKDQLNITVSGKHDAKLDNADYRLAALDDPWVKGQRAEVATALSDAGFGTYKAAEIDLSRMAHDKRLTDWPMIRQLGA